MYGVQIPICSPIGGTSSPDVKGKQSSVIAFLTIQGANEVLPNLRLVLEVITSSELQDLSKMVLPFRMQTTKSQIYLIQEKWEV